MNDTIFSDYDSRINDASNEYYFCDEYISHIRFIGEVHDYHPELSTEEYEVMIKPTREVAEAKLRAVVEKYSVDVIDL